MDRVREGWGELKYDRLTHSGDAGRN
jgi:hypothetical protein